MNEAKDYVEDKIDKQTRTQYQYTLNRIIYLAKKEVFDDIEEIMGSILGGFGDTPTYIKYKEVKQKHLTNNSNITNNKGKKE